MANDAVSPCVAKPSTVMALTMQDHTVDEELFKQNSLNASSQHDKS